MAMYLNGCPDRHIAELIGGMFDESHAPSQKPDHTSAGRKLIVFSMHQ
jgi:hypothetical protein